MNSDISLSLLRSFLAVADTRSFSAAALQLGLGQSTVSQHVKRLEEILKRQLLLRDTHSVRLTHEGDAMLELARTVLDANERMASFFIDQKQHERLRIGISEDFAMLGLAQVLTNFKRRHPHVDIELTVGLSGYLYQRFDAGEVDLIFAKRKPGDKRGRTAWREQLVWIARPRFRIPRDLPVPLVAYASPSITRSLAINALEGARRPWRMACSSGSLSGLQAALAAGLGVAAHSSRLIPRGMARLEESDLPPLPEIEFVVIGPGPSHPLAMRMAEMLADSPEPLQRMPD